jgi:UDP-N-acetylmuramoyl-tripeptide--D-alanyl-D-alanine ligase
VGRDAAADYVIGAVRLDSRLRPTFVLNGQSITVPLHGEHHVDNAALAAAVAHAAFGVEFAEIATQIDGALRGRWRMEFLETDDGIVVLNDAYNANPTSMRAALSALAHLALAPGARRVAVLGDMRELGVHHDDAHREIGECAAEFGIDVVVGVGAGGGAIAEVAARSGVATELAPDAAGASRLIGEMARSGDAVLVKGSRALALERVADEMLARGRDRAGGAP